MLAIEPKAHIASTKKSSWLHLDETTVMNRVEVLKKYPNLINQGALGLCGEAAFFRHVLQRRPLLFGVMAELLFMDGWGFVGDLVIHPDSDLRDADYPQIVADRGSTFPPIPEQADWMVMSALCDTENLILDFEGTPSESYADGAYFSQMVQWYRKSRLYTSVTQDDDTDLAHVKTNVLKTANSHIVLWIRTAMIQSGSSGRHFITLETPMVIDEQHDSIYFDYWTWGHATSDGASLTVTKFMDNYLGAIIATF
jgi:hypothetical protein